MASKNYRIDIYSDEWRDIVRDGVKVGVAQVRIARGVAARPRSDALRIMNYIRKRGHMWTFIVPAARR